MDKILFGVALGQVLAVLLLVVLELLVSMASWYLAETLWRSLVRGLDQIGAGIFRLFGPVTRRTAC